MNGAEPRLEIPTGAWMLFGAVVVVSLVVDLVVHRGGRGSSRKHALAWSVAWIALSFAFAGWIASSSEGPATNS